MATLDLLDEDVMTRHEQSRLDRIEGSALDGWVPINDEIREVTGSGLVGVRRNGDVETDVDGGVDIGDDEFSVAGTDEAADAFASEFAG